MAGSNDKELERRVQGMLDESKEFKGYGLKAQVVDGVVMVSGVVDTLWEKDRLRESLADLDGVKGIDLGIAVSTDGAIDDEDVAREVMEELNANPGVDPRHVGARSVGGTVFLVGTVETPEEEREAVKAASKARGVKKVTSRLEIKPGGYDDESIEAIFHHQVNNDNEDEGEAKIF